MQIENNQYFQQMSQWLSQTQNLDANTMSQENEDCCTHEKMGKSKRPPPPPPPRDSFEWSNEEDSTETYSLKQFFGAQSQQIEGESGQIKKSRERFQFSNNIFIDQLLIREIHLYANNIGQPTDYFSQYIH